MPDVSETSPELLVVVGPTGAGKTELAISIAQHIGAEIVSADSQQVYRGMDIGTGKASTDEQALVRQHLLDVVEPDEEMTAARFVELADEVIATLALANKPVIVAGGTMLYVRALLRGLFEGPAADAATREALRAQARERGVASLWAELNEFDPDSAGRINDTDERRLIRAIEVYRQSGVPLSEHHRRHQEQPPRYRARIIGLQPEVRKDLYAQIDARVERMMSQGLLEEVIGLRQRGYGPDTRSQLAIGYAELHRHLDGSLTLAEAVALIQRNSRRYARRQLSWYRGEAIEWFSAPDAVDLKNFSM